MYRDPSEFRERFQAYKNGKSVREIYGLPGYAEGTVGADPELDMIKKYEGWRDKTYLDSKGIPTIGWGFTDSSLISKGRMSRREGDVYLSKRVEKRKAYLRNKLGPQIWDKLDTATKSAFLSYDHNYPAGFGDDTRFMKHWRAGRYNDAVSEMNAGMNDESSPGLRTRRLDEQATVRKDSFLFPKVKSQKPEDALIQKSDVTRTVTIPTAQQQIISRADRRNTVGAEIDRTIWANKVMHDIQGMAYDIPVWESPSLPALTPVEYDVTPLKNSYEDGKISQGNKQIPIDELHGWARRHDADEPWYIRYSKNVTDGILNTVESFTEPYRNTINGRMGVDDAIGIGLDVGAGIGAKAIRRAAKSIKPTKTSISLKGKTPRELAEYFEQNPDLITDADPIKVAEAADFIEQDALPRVQRAANKRGRNVTFNPKSITFKQADFRDSKLGGVSTPNKTVYMRDNASTDHYVHEMSHEMRRATGETPEEASRLFSTYKNSDAFLKAHPEFAQLQEDEAINTQLRYLISHANGGVKGKELDSIIDNMPYDKFETYAILANAYTNDMAKTGGLNRNTYKNTLKYVGATYPMLYAASQLRKHKDGKLPGYYEGELPMGEKKQLTYEEVKQAAANTPHEQGMSGEDPLMSGLVGLKVMRLVGDQLSERRLKERVEMYKRFREANEQTRGASRAWKMQDADRMARNWGYSNNPLGFLYDIFLDPLANLYTKIQKHPILGPLIPFKDGKLPEYSNGKIRINPANRGKFNATKKRTGKTTEELTHSKNPLTRKRAIFAQNARKWNHK